MIGTFLSIVGKFLAGPLVDIAGGYFKTQTDQFKVRGDVQMAKTAADTDLGIAAFETEAVLSDRRPFMTVLMQSVLQGICLLYLAALVIVSALPLEGWEVKSLPSLWELLILFILAGLAGPQVLNILKDRFFK